MSEFDQRKTRAYFPVEILKNNEWADVDFSSPE